MDFDKRLLLIPIFLILILILKYTPDNELVIEDNEPITTDIEKPSIEQTDNHNNNIDNSKTIINNIDTRPPITVPNGDVIEGESVKIGDIGSVGRDLDISKTDIDSHDITTEHIKVKESQTNTLSVEDKVTDTSTIISTGNRRVSSSISNSGLGLDDLTSIVKLEATVLENKLGDTLDSNIEFMNNELDSLMSNTETKIKRLSDALKGTISSFDNRLTITNNGTKTSINNTMIEIENLRNTTDARKKELESKLYTNTYKIDQKIDDINLSINEKITYLDKNQLSSNKEIGDLNKKLKEEINALDKKSLKKIEESTNKLSGDIDVKLTNLEVDVKARDLNNTIHLLKESKKLSNMIKQNEIKDIKDTHVIKETITKETMERISDKLENISAINHLSNEIKIAKEESEKLLKEEVVKLTDMDKNITSNVKDLEYNITSNIADTKELIKKESLNSLIRDDNISSYIELLHNNILLSEEKIIKIDEKLKSALARVSETTLKAIDDIQTSTNDSLISIIDKMYNFPTKEEVEQMIDNKIEELYNRLSEEIKIIKNDTKRTGELFWWFGADESCPVGSYPLEGQSIDNIDLSNILESDYLPDLTGRYIRSSSGEPGYRVGDLLSDTTAVNGLNITTKVLSESPISLNDSDATIITSKKVSGIPRKTYSLEGDVETRPNSVVAKLCIKFK